MKRILAILSAAILSAAAFAQTQTIYKFTPVKDIPVTSVKNQAATGTCWCFATVSFLEAELLRQYMQRSGLSQAQAARRLGRSQSAVANKLRLLGHPAEVRSALRERGLSERHARELLRVSGTQARLAVIEEISDRRLSVTQTEKYIDAYLENGRPPVSDKLRRRDARLFLERVARDTAGLRRSGMAAEFQCREEPEAFLLTVRIEK